MKEINPPKEILLNIIALIQKSSLNDAEKETQKLIKEYSKSFFLFNILGLINVNKKKFSEAVLNYKKSINLNQNYSDAYNNLGLAYFEMSDLDKAKSNFEKAVSINSSFYIAHTNLAKLYFLNLDYRSAFKHLRVSLELEPNYMDTIILLKDFLCMEMQFERCEPILYLPIINLIKKYNLVQPTYISRSVINLLKKDNIISELIDTGWENIDKNNLLKVLVGLKGNSLLVEFMKICPFPDLELENVFKKIRREIFFFSFSQNEYGIVKEIIEALAEQCLLNEFIYDESDAETSKINEYEKRIFESKLLINEIDITKLSLYRRLSNYSGISKIKKELINFSAQKAINETVLEKDLKQNIQSFGKSKNDVSKLVKQQYEENPYPRWAKPTLLVNRVTVKTFLKKIDIKLGEHEYDGFERPDILVAGCGTGQHAINTSSVFQDSEVTAVDLSFNSLAYAKRKSIELKLDNINFIQGDLLNIGKLDKKFDIIESVGVIHHMDDPVAGLRSLRSALKDNGLIQLGLYSKIARRHILKFQKEYLKDNTNFGIKNLRKNRKLIINTTDESIKSIMHFNDFFSLSDFRDMLFHVRECTYSINEIVKLLNEVNLKFCGFVGFTNNGNERLNINTEGFDRFNLVDWDQRERENPDIFRGMYQFWCKKNSS